MSEHHLPTTNEKGISSTACPPAAKRGRTAGAQSPHIVIRGETSPRNNQSQQTAHIDWLAFTFVPPPEACPDSIVWLLPQLFTVFNLPGVTVQSTGRGWQGYTNKLNIGDNAQYGLIAHGGEKQCGTVHVSLNATACAHVTDWHTTQQWCESLVARIARIDLAHDDMQGEVVTVENALVWHKSGGFTNSGRPPKGRLIDDLGSGEGKTFYVGSRANGKQVCIYEKGKQLGDPLSLWVRAEVRLGNKNRIIPLDVLTTPATYLAGTFPCMAYLSATQNKIRTISRAMQITIESIEHHLRTMGGKSINVLLQEYGGDTVALVNAIKRDGIPRRLVNYADYLPRVPDDSEVIA